MASILVTTDGSEHSLRVLPHAVLFARCLGGTVGLTRVLNPLTDAADEFALSTREAVTTVRERWQDQLEAVLTRPGLHGDAQVVIQRRREDTAGAIRRTAREAGATVIAMDSRGAGRLSHLVAGGTALGVLARSTVPVLMTGPAAVPQGTGSSSCRVLFTTDGSGISLAFASLLGNALASSGFHVTVLRLLTRTEKTDTATAAIELERVVAALPAGLPATGLVRESREGNLPDDILAFAAEDAASAVAMATHSYSALRHLISGSVAMGVLARSRIPLLLGRAGTRKR